MGLIILPVLALALAAGIIALVRLIIFAADKALSRKAVAQGVLLSLLLQALVFGSFIAEKEYWAFSPLLRYPFCAVFLPFLVFLPLALSKNESARHLTKVILAAVVFSCVSGCALFFFYEDLLAFFGARGHY